MTVTATNVFSGPFTPNGSTTAFPFTFKAMSAAEISVVRRLSSGAIYAVAGYTVAISSTNGGTVNFSSPPAAGDPLYILANPSFQQQINFANQGSWSPTVNNQANDRSAVRDLWLKAQFERSIRAPQIDAIAELPAALNRASRFLRFDTNGTALDLLDADDLGAAIHSQIAAYAGELARGDPGGNVMAAGLFTAMPGMAISSATTIIRTTGYDMVGLGGAFYFEDAAVDAAYVTANPRTSFISANGGVGSPSRGFRLSLDQQLRFSMFGVRGDNVTDNFAALQAAIDFSAANKMTTQYGYGKGGPSLLLSASPFAYFCSQRLVVNHTLHWMFENGAGAAGGVSVLRFPAGTGGILLKHDNITGGAAGSVLERPFAVGGFAGVEGEYPGIEFQAPCRMIDPKAIGFQGDGIFTDTHGTGYIVNGSVIDNPFTQGNRTGLGLYGEDANAVVVNNPVGILNRRYGHWQKLTLGSAIVGGNTAGNGMVPGFPTMCTLAGNRYYCLPDQEAWAKANPPSGTTANNTGWGYFGAGGAAVEIPAWANTIDFRAGGAARFEGSYEQNVTVAYYYEADQPPIQIASTAQMLFLGFISGTPKTFTGTNYPGRIAAGAGGGLETAGGLTINGDFRALVAGLEILRVDGAGAHVNASLAITSDVGAALIVGRTAPGGVSIIAPDGGAGLDIRNPDGTTGLSLANAAATMSKPLHLPDYNKAALPATTSHQLIFVNDDVGGLTLAYSNGASWRRVADNAVIS